MILGVIASSSEAYQRSFSTITNAFAQTFLAELLILELAMKVDVMAMVRYCWPKRVSYTDQLTFPKVELHRNHDQIKETRIRMQFRTNAEECHNKLQDTISSNARISPS